MTCRQARFRCRDSSLASRSSSVARPVGHALDFVTMAPPTVSDFEALDVRVGTVSACVANDGARHPALALTIDFGTHGMKQSSAQITELYTPEDLIGSQVVALTGLDPIRVGGFVSEALVIGVLAEGGVVLLRPERPVDPGSRVA